MRSVSSPNAVVLGAGRANATNDGGDTERILSNVDTSRPSTSSGASSAPSPVSPSNKSPAISVQASSHSSGSPGVAGSPSAVILHRIAIALLSIILAIDSLVDKRPPPAPHNAQAEHYYQLTRAALTTIPSVYGTETSPNVQE